MHAHCCHRAGVTLRFCLSPMAPRHGEKYSDTYPPFSDC